MQIDIGEIRFLTKVAEKSPRGLRLLLFKEKATGKEKLVFIVKTASEDVEKLALSKMTWQVEASKVAPRVVIVRLLILPEGSNEFFQSETGLLMNEQKDRRCLDALSVQKSVEIYFFTYEAEFHSKIELLTTYNMGLNAKAALDANPIVDEDRLIVKSENFSENDIKSALTGKTGQGLKEKDLAESIQKKMPTVSSSIPKAKPSEFSKTSIKSNDIATSGKGNVPPPQQAQKKKDLTQDEIRKTTASSSAKLTPDDLLKSIPPGSISINKPTPPQTPKSPEVQEMDELMKAFESFQNTPITPEDLMKTIPPDSLKADSLLKSIKSEDLFSSSSGQISEEDLFKTVPTNDLTPEELLRSLSGDTITASSGGLKAEDLLKSIEFTQPGISSTPSEGGLKTEDLLKSFDLNPTDILNNDDLFSALKSDDSNDSFIDMVPTADLLNRKKPISEKDDMFFIDNEPTKELRFSKTMEDFPIKDLELSDTHERIGETQSELVDTIENLPKTPESISKKEIVTEKLNIISDINKSPDKLIDTIENFAKSSEIVNKNGAITEKLNLVTNVDTTPPEFVNTVVDLKLQIPELGKIINELPKRDTLSDEHTDTLPPKAHDFSKTMELKHDELMDALKSEPSPLKLPPEKEKALWNDLMSEPSPLKALEGEDSEMMKNIDSNIKFVNTNSPLTSNTIPPATKKLATTTPPPPKKEEISEDDLLKALKGEI